MAVVPSIETATEKPCLARPIGLLAKNFGAWIGSAVAGRVGPSSAAHAKARKPSHTVCRTTDICRRRPVWDRAVGGEAMVHGAVRRCLQSALDYNRFLARNLGKHRCRLESTAASSPARSVAMVITNRA